MDMNDAIRAAVGQPSAGGTIGSSSDKAPVNTAALRSIATNGALLNQNMSRLIQALNALKTAWGG